ncbi:MAG: HAD family phosphatase [Eubacteriales bacterium]|nr:HAD family phosphatase [Eubacteriales bacterium]
MDTRYFKHLEAIIFDMDGLMFDSERLVQKSWDIAGAQIGYGPLGYHITNTLGMNRTVREIYFKQQYGEEFPYDHFHNTYRNAYNELAKNGGAPAKEGLHEILSIIKKCQLKCAVATSSSPNHAWAHLKREHIEEYFDAVITGDMVTYGKPDPDIYLKACSALQVNPANAMALEDAINGIRAAHSAGMIPVIIPDLVQDISPVRDIVAGVYTSLLDVAAELENFFLHKQR